MTSAIIKKYGNDIERAYKERAIAIHRDTCGTIEYVYRYVHTKGYAIKAIGINPYGVRYKGTFCDYLRKGKGAFWFQYTMSEEKAFIDSVIKLPLDELREQLYDINNYQLTV